MNPKVCRLPKQLEVAMIDANREIRRVAVTDYADSAVRASVLLGRAKSKCDPRQPERFVRRQCGFDDVTVPWRIILDNRQVGHCRIFRRPRYRGIAFQCNTFGDVQSRSPAKRSSWNHDGVTVNGQRIVYRLDVGHRSI
jgi:hypothetical protein